MIGFSLNSYNESVKHDISKSSDDEETVASLINDQKEFLQHLPQAKKFLSEKFNASWIDMPKGSIVIDRSGGIYSIDENIINQADGLTKEKYPDLESEDEYEEESNKENYEPTTRVSSASSVSFSQARQSQSSKFEGK